MTFYFVLVYLVYFIQANYFKKYLAENAVNTISETLDFKIFWWRIPPDPPTNSRLRREFSAPRLQNTLRRPWTERISHFTGITCLHYVSTFNSSQCFRMRMYSYRKKNITCMFACLFRLKFGLGDSSWGIILSETLDNNRKSFCKFHFGL